MAKTSWIQSESPWVWLILFMFWFLPQSIFCQPSLNRRTFEHKGSQYFLPPLVHKSHNQWILKYHTVGSRLVNHCRGEVRLPQVRTVEVRAWVKLSLWKQSEQPVEHLHCVYWPVSALDHRNHHFFQVVMLFEVLQIVLLVNVQVTEQIQLWVCLFLVLFPVNQDQLNLFMGRRQNNCLGLRHQIGLDHLYHEIMVVEQNEEINRLPHHELQRQVQLNLCQKHFMMQNKPRLLQKLKLKVFPMLFVLKVPQHFTHARKSRHVNEIVFSDGLLPQVLSQGRHRCAEERALLEQQRSFIHFTRLSWYHLHLFQVVLCDNLLQHFSVQKS